MRYDQACALQNSMKNPCNLLVPSLFWAVVSFAPVFQAFAEDYKPELFKSTKLVYEDSFDSGKINEEFWEVRQSSTWVIKDGVLTGSQSSKEFQEKKIAAGDKAHAGFKPVIWLRQVPAEFVCTFRLKYSAEAYHPKFPLVDLGHHYHTLVFGEDKTTLVIKKDVQTMTVDKQFLPLNEWVDVAIELKKGAILLTMNGQKQIFESAEIDMGDQRQIDFKGVDFGTCEIDDIRVWEGGE